MSTSLHPWVSAMFIAVMNIRNNPDLKAVKYHPLLINRNMPTFVELPLMVYKANNDNVKSSD